MRAPFVAEVRLFSFGFAPAGWTPCDGRLLDIDEHQPLFSLVGWRHGGDGSTTFAVPAVTAAPPFSSDFTGCTWCIATDGVYAPRTGDRPVDEPLIGEIRMFAGPYAPAGWVVCDGRRLPIEAPYDALYDLIGRAHGGDAETFAVPDLREHSASGITYIIASAGVRPREA